MKELSIEEKAKAYDEKLDVARHIYADPSVKDEDKYYIEVIFPELDESEDERIRNFLISKMKEVGNVWKEYSAKDIIAYLEKQGKHANFRNKIQIGDKVTRNEDGVLVNLSQLNRVAKKDEKQREQNLANSAKTCNDGQKPVIPKFRVGDVITKQAEDTCLYHYDVIKVEQDYILAQLCGHKSTIYISFNDQENWKLSEQKPVESFKIEKDKWYKCIKDYVDRTAGLLFKAGSLYKGGINSSIIYEGETEEKVFDKFGVQFYDDANKYFMPVNFIEQKEWSEEDEKNVADYLYCLNVGFTQVAARQRAKDICNLLRPQNHWKPSEEQIRVVARLRHCLLEDVRGNDVVILDNLLEQLKAL